MSVGEGGELTSTRQQTLAVLWCELWHTPHESHCIDDQAQLMDLVVCSGSYVLVASLQHLYQNICTRGFKLQCDKSEACAGM